MSLSSSTDSAYVRTDFAVVSDFDATAGVNQAVAREVVSPSSADATANIAGLGSSEYPSVILTSQYVPPGSLLKGFSVSVLSENSGVITGVGVFDVVSGKYSDLYVLRNHPPVSDAADVSKANWQQLQGGSNPGSITLASITTSKVLVRPMESVFYSPGLYPASITSGGAPYGTSGVLENRTVLAFAGYGPDAVSGSFRPFLGGGSFVANATFEWAASAKSILA
jgi:hypothetical protein